MPKNMLSEAQDRYWYGYASRLPIMQEFRRYGDVIDLPNTVDQALHELQNGAFAAGARWATRETSALSPHIARFTEMLILLGVFDAETVAENGDEASSTSASYTNPFDPCSECGSNLHPLSAHVFVPPTDARDDA